MKTSVLLLTTLVAAALFTAVLGGLPRYRGQRYNYDAYEDQAQKEQLLAREECPNSNDLSCSQMGAPVCFNHDHCGYDEVCCNAQRCPRPYGVCSSGAKIESHAMNVNDEDQAQKEQLLAREECPNSNDLSCSQMGAPVCFNHDHCGYDEVCCNAQRCPRSYGVCSSGAKIESHDMNLNDEDQAQKEQLLAREECPNSNDLSCSQMGAPVCFNHDHCGYNEVCCNAQRCPRPYGVCSSGRAKIESHDMNVN